MAGDQQLKNARNRIYLAKDFDAFRSDLLRYSQTYFGDKIQDFSESGVGGLLLDMAASVSDSMSFYMDHQFKEMSWSTAVETKNLNRMIQEAGIKPKGASPAAVNVSFYIEVPADLISGEYVPRESALPVIEQGTILASTSGVLFNVTEDIDFAKKDTSGDLVALKTIGTVSGAVIQTFILRIDSVCVSGNSITETFSIPSNPSPFFKLTLSNPNVSEILRVFDSDGNDYYEVAALSQDTVFAQMPNFGADSAEVKSIMSIKPAPRRFVTINDVSARTTTIQFGGGNASTTDDDAIPDPETLALPLYGTSTLSSFSIDPNALLQTKTLGIMPMGTNISVTYRYGGGLNHNISAKSIAAYQQLKIRFPSDVSADDARNVRTSFDVTNEMPATGGDSAPSIEDLRSQIPAARNSQSRIVTKEDLLARIYTIPTQFGRVFRAGVRPNPNNPLAVQLFIASKDSNGFLTTSPDTLKLNLRTYLNSYRLIGDAFDILDSRVINFGIKFAIYVNPNSNKPATIQAVISNLSRELNVRNFQIDQPIMISDIQNIIINTPGVLSLVDTGLKVENIVGNYQDRVYSTNSFDVSRNTFRGIINPPPGGIFELRYPSFDIVGTAL